MKDNTAQHIHSYIFNTRKYLVTYVLLGINIGWIVFIFIDRDRAVKIVGEDQLVQWFQFFFIILTAIYCYKAYLEERGKSENEFIRTVLLTCFVLAILLALEEISWGQRIFNIETPEMISKINVQKELTIHNLDCFQRYRHWLLLIFGIVGLGLICINDKYHIKNKQLSVMVPPSSFKLAFCLAIISGLFLETAYHLQVLFPGPISKGYRFWAGRYSEIGELCVVITAFCYATYMYSKSLITISKTDKK